MSDLYTYLPHHAILVREPSEKFLDNSKLRFNIVRPRLKRQRVKNAYITELKLSISVLLRLRSAYESFQPLLFFRGVTFHTSSDLQNVPDLAVDQL